MPGRNCFVTDRRNVATHLDEILELLRDADHEEPGGEVELGLGEGPLTAGLPALGRHPAEERDLRWKISAPPKTKLILCKYCQIRSHWVEIAPSPESTFSWARSQGTGSRPHTHRRWWCLPPWP